MVTGGVASLPSASYEKHTMLAMPDSRIIMASTALRKHLARSEFIVVAKIAVQYFGDE
jgi:hypothetical protein